MLSELVDNCILLRNRLTPLLFSVERWERVTMISALPNILADSIYVVATSKGNTTVYWAAATQQAEAVTAVQHRIPPGWTAILTDRRLTPDQVVSLQLRPGGVRQLKFSGVFDGKSLPR